MNNKKKKRKQRSFGSIALAMLIFAAMGVFIYSAFMLWGTLQEYKSGEEEYQGLLQYVQPGNQDAAGQTATDTDNGQEGGLQAEALPMAPITVDFEQLRKVNGDIVGWIYAEAIPEISYPIVQGKDNDYYLHYTVEKKKNASASIFLDYRNSPLFSDAMTIVYGHNMKNKAMFGRLKNYRDTEVYEKSPYVWILTPEEDLCYEIFSVRVVKADDSLYSLNFSLGETQKNYMEKMQKKSETENSVSCTGNEPMLTLSTCTGNDSTRWIVQAVLKE